MMVIYYVPKDKNWPEVIVKPGDNQKNNFVDFFLSAAEEFKNMSDIEFNSYLETYWKAT